MPDPLIALLVGILFLGLLLLLFLPKGGLIGYFQRMRRLSDRVLIEDALKHLHKTSRHGQVTTIESIAGALQISTARSAKLLENMQKQDLVSLDGEIFILTPTGRNYAVQVIRAHRLWERYLSEETGFNEYEWHDQAEKFEHELSNNEVNNLSAHLGHPTHDPHGDPIPTSQGQFVLHGGQPLHTAPLNIPMRIVHMEDEPEAVFAQLVAEGLHPGMQIQLLESSPNRIRFWANGDEHILAPIVAASLSVLPIPNLEPVENQIGEPLNNLQPGETGKVVVLSPLLRGQERRRMLDMGILPGTIIESELKSPGGDPTAYRIRGALIALRNDQAKLIRIDPIKEVTP